MRSRSVTKVLLAVIALALLVVACRPLVRPERVAASQPEVLVLCSMCMSMSSGPMPAGLLLMDKNTGDVWIYTDAALAGTQPPIKWGHLTLGKPIARNQ
jgi:hypothetical protein